VREDISKKRFPKENWREREAGVKDDLLQKILRLEWEMFSQVSNAGGKAACQSDPASFAVMRASQAETWPEELLESWLGDLEAAKRQGRNLMSEKYARMMESTWPEEYRQIAGRLPALDAGTADRIEEIVGRHVAWKLAVLEDYPLLGEKGRPVRSEEDSPRETSFESYLRGELKSYSPETVRLLHRHTETQREAGINAVAEILLRQAQKYGYRSLMEAECAQAAERARPQLR
jgi:hypothetical protein